jgi:exosortase/archaeosortase family protein
LRYVLKALFWMLLLCGLFFYPYADGSWPSMAIDGYLRGIAQASAFVIRRFSPEVGVHGRHISGAFPLEIVKACSLLDAQAFYVGAALAFPSKPLRRLAGIVAGASLLALLNVLRIAALYFIGLHVPQHFDALHEEWLPAILVAAACLTFAGFVHWAARSDEPAAAR